MKSKVLMICPKYPPLKDGLSGHTFELCKELTKQHTVELLTDQSIQSQEDTPVTIHPLLSKWKYSQLKRNFEKLQTDYNLIIIQYVPSLYGKKGGINFSILLFFLWLRFIKKQNISFIFHELYYPFLWNWKAITLHIIHKTMLFFSILSAKQAFYSTRHNLKIGKRFSIVKKGHFHLPVGASIDIDKQNIIETHNNKNTYTLFGGFHPSKRYDLIIDTFSRFKMSHPNCLLELNLIGLTKDELSQQTTLPKNFDTFAKCHGKLTDQEVQIIFKASHYLIAYFSDGMSTRRSSAISALASGLPIITTKSLRTEKLFFNQSSVVLFDTNEAQFQKALSAFLLKPNNQTENNALNFYQENFSWEKISNHLISRSLSKF